MSIENTIDLIPFFKNLKKNKTKSIQPSFLLAFSGGIDSVVLLHAVLHCGIKPIIAHCNFQLRHQDSEQDEKFSRLTANALKLDIIVKKFKVDPNKNTQLEARRLRYDWFNTLLTNNNINFCLLGHHANDQVETVLLNMIRGTGIKGLKLAQQRGCFLRPLLSYSRHTIQQYAIAQQLQWREDKSNENIKYKRNYIRHNIVPHLQKLNPNITSTVARNAHRFTQTDQLATITLKKIEEKYVQKFEDGFYIDIKGLKDYLKYDLDEVILYHLIGQQHFTYLQCEQIINAIHQKGAYIDSSDQSYRLYIDKERWYCFPEKKPDALYINDLNGIINYHYWIYKLEILDKKPTFDEGADVAYLCLSSLKKPLRLRFKEEGDYFSPLGLKGQTKKISQFLTDQKTLRAIKDRQVVLEDAEKIIWVVGNRISEHAKIDFSVNTLPYLKIKRSKNHHTNGLETIF